MICLLFWLIVGQPIFLVVIFWYLQDWRNASLVSSMYLSSHFTHSIASVLFFRKWEFCISAFVLMWFIKFPGFLINITWSFPRFIVKAVTALFRPICFFCQWQCFMLLWSLSQKGKNNLLICTLGLFQAHPRPGVYLLIWLACINKYCLSQKQLIILEQYFPRQFPTFFGRNYISSPGFVNMVPRSK